MRLSLEMEIDYEDLAFQLSRILDNSEMLEFIRVVDERVADWTFSKMMAEYFVDTMRRIEPAFTGEPKMTFVAEGPPPIELVEPGNRGYFPETYGLPEKHSW